MPRLNSAQMTVNIGVDSLGVDGAKKTAADDQETQAAIKAEKIDEYSLLGKEVMAYCVPFVYAGWKRPLEAAMVPELPRYLDVERLGPDLERTWEREKEAAAKKGRRPSLALAYASTMSCSIAKGISVALFNGAINSFVRPMLLRQCLLWMAEPQR